MGFPKRASAPRGAGWSLAISLTPTFAADDVNERHMLALKGAIE